MTDRNDVLADLDAALNVEPSAAFAQGARARVAQSRVRTRQMWWGLAAAATVTLATVALWRPAVVPETETTTQVQSNTVAPAVPPAALETVPVRAAANHAIAAAPRIARVEEASAPALSSVATASEPRLEVITNQPALLQQMWEQARGLALPKAAVELEGVIAPGDPKPIAPIVVDPIVVAPIVVRDIGTTVGRGGVTPSIRRVDAARDMR